jgi:hypothetical protein
LIQVLRQYSEWQVVTLWVANALRQAGISLQRVREVVRYMSSLAATGRQARDVEGLVVLDNRSVYFVERGALEDGRVLVDVLNEGQIVIAAALDAAVRAAARGLAAAEHRPRGRPKAGARGGRRRARGRRGAKGEG